MSTQFNVDPSELSLIRLWHKSLYVSNCASLPNNKNLISHLSFLERTPCHQHWQSCHEEVSRTLTLYDCFEEPYEYNRDHVEHVPSQWETTLHCNVVSHWLGAYTKRSLICLHFLSFLNSYVTQITEIPPYMNADSHATNQSITSSIQSKVLKSHPNHCNMLLMLVNLSAQDIL